MISVLMCPSYKSPCGTKLYYCCFLSAGDDPATISSSGTEDDTTEEEADNLGNLHLENIGLTLIIISVTLITICDLDHVSDL